MERLGSPVGIDVQRRDTHRVSMVSERNRASVFRDPGVSPTSEFRRKIKSPVDSLIRLVDGRGEPEILGVLDHRDVGSFGQRGRGAVTGCVVDHDDLICDVLRGRRKRIEALQHQVAGVPVHDQDRNLDARTRANRRAARSALHSARAALRRRRRPAARAWSSRPNWNSAATALTTISAISSRSRDWCRGVRARRPS